MPWLEPITLRGPYARLEPLSHDHRDGLVEAVKDGSLPNLWYTAIPQPENMAKEIDRRLGLQAAGSMLPFTVFDVEDRISGMTTYMNVDTANRRVEIGSTWYAKACAAQRGQYAVQTAAAAHMRSRSSIASPSSSARISSITRAVAASSVWVRSRTASCAAIRSRPTARCATPWFTASSPASGRR